MSGKQFHILLLAFVFCSSRLIATNDGLPTEVTAQHGAELAPILIGVSNVQSGPSSSLGKDLLRGSLAYFDLVNRRGGIHGRKIKLIIKDDGYEPDPAVENTNELITRENVLFLFDYVGTPTLTRVLPLLRYYEDQDIVNVAPFTGADPQRKPPYEKYVFNIRASYREEIKALTDYLCAKGYGKIGFLGQADAYGRSGEISVIEALARHGLKLVESVTYRRNQPAEASMRAQVDLLRKAGAEAVIIVGLYGPAAGFIRDARLSGWNVPVANVSFAGAFSMLRLLQQSSAQLGRDLTTNLINSLVVPLPRDTEYPLVAAYNASMPSDSVDSTSLEGWLNAVVVTEALRRAGPHMSRRNFVRAMGSLGGWDPGLGLRLAFSPTDHQALHKVWLAKTQAGQWIAEKGSY